MRKILFIIFTVIWVIPNFAQEDCWTEYDNVVPDFSPAGSPIAISTYGWNYDSTHSIEFNNSFPQHNFCWHIYGGYQHHNAFNGFSDSTKYWDLDTINGILQLHLYDDSATVHIDYLDTTYVTGYTTAMLAHNNMGDFDYGYIEAKIKIPVDSTLCSSLWNFDTGNNDLYYREIDLFETINTKMLFNIYHELTSSSDRSGGKLRMNMSLFNENDWYIWGVEWLPRSYRLYINHNLVGEFNADYDCTEDYFSPIRYWRLWITNWIGNGDPTGTFPKTLTANYIRFYSLDTDNINNDFYNYLSDYDYGVWKTVHLGDTYSSDATFNDNGRHAIRSTDGFTLGAGFEVASGTEFETIIYKP
jgi:hypothetical protein